MLDESSQRHLIDRLESGDVRKGTVTEVLDFGAYVDLGGCEGLITLLELSWRRLRHPSDILKPGQEVTSLVIGVDREGQKVTLSLKALTPDPLLEFAKQNLGASIRGRVSKRTPLGIFVEVTDGIEGLILPQSEAERVKLADTAPGSEIQVAISEINVYNRRIALRMN